MVEEDCPWNPQTALKLGMFLFLNILSHSILIYEQSLDCLPWTSRATGFVSIEYAYSCMMLCFISLLCLIFFSSENDWILIEFGLDVLMIMLWIFNSSHQLATRSSFMKQDVA